jgi:hypothetical protein
MEEGKNIPMNLQELEEVIEIFNRIQSWLSHTSKEIEKGVQLDLIEEFFRAVGLLF